MVKARAPRFSEGMNGAEQQPNESSRYEFHHRRRHGSYSGTLVLLTYWRKRYATLRRRVRASATSNRLPRIEEIMGHSNDSDSRDTRTSVIGLAGHAQSGKDSVAAVLTGFGFHQYAFADAIKDGLEALDPLLAPNVSLQQAVAENGWDMIKADRHVGPEVGRLLQSYRDVLRDTFGATVLIDIVERAIHADAQPLVVVSDVRLPREAEWIRSIGGTIWLVDRPLTFRTRPSHYTEVPLPGHLIDDTIANNAGLAELDDKVCAAMARLGRTRLRTAHRDAA